MAQSDRLSITVHCNPAMWRHLVVEKGIARLRDAPKGEHYFLLALL